MICDLERGDWEIADGDELERVLYDIEDGRDGKFPAIWAEYFTAEVIEGEGPKITDIEEGRFPVTC